MTNYDDDDDDKALQEFLAKKKAANLHSSPSNFNHQSSRNIFASFDASSIAKSTSPKKPSLASPSKNKDDDDDDDEKAMKEFLNAKKSKAPPGAFNTQSSRNVLAGFSPSKPKVSTLATTNNSDGASGDFLAPFTITETPASARKEKEDDDQKALSEFMTKKQNVSTSKNTASSRNIFEGLDASAMLKVGVSASLRVAPKLTRENSSISQKPRGMLRREGSSLMTNENGTLARPPPLLRGNSTMTSATPSAPRRGMLQRENSSFITRKNNEFELSDKPSVTVTDVPTKRGTLQRENSLMMREGSHSVPRARPPLERGMSRNDQGYKQSINQRFLSKMKTKNDGFDDFPDTVSEISVMSVRSTETALLSDREINEEVGFTHQAEFVQLNHLVSQFVTCGFPVLVFDKLGSIEYLNKEAEDLFGVFSFSALGEHVSELFLDDASVELHQAIYEFLGPTENSSLKASKIGSNQGYLDDILPYNQISEEEKLERRRALSQLRILRAKATTIKQFFSVSAKIMPISKLQETHFCIYMKFAQQAENGKYSQMTNSLNQAVTEMITIPVITINDKGIIQVFNKAASATFGFESKEVVGRNVKIICNKKDRLKHDSYLEKCKTKDKNSLNMIKKVKGETKSGKIISVEIRVSHILRDGKPSYIAYLRDYKAMSTPEEHMTRIAEKIFPKSIAERLSMGQTVIDTIDSCSMLYCDMVGFTAMSSNRSPKEVVKILHEIFTRFDDVCTELNLEKIKTIGDCYFIASGLSKDDTNHADNVVKGGLAMIKTMKQYTASTNTDHLLSVRLGIHTGNDVIAAVVGKVKRTYDLFGPAVETAQLMEATGKVNQVHISNVTYKELRSETTKAFFIEHFMEGDELALDKHAGPIIMPMNTWISHND